MTRMTRHIVVASIPSAPLLTDTRRSTVGPGTREDVVPCTCCVRSAVLVVEHITLAPAAIAAPVSVAEHIAPFLQFFAKVEMHAESELPALEKYELVERLVRALELGQFPEEYDDSRDALVRFARRLTHHLDAIGERWVACRADQTTVCLAGRGACCKKSAAADE